jgi:hypothetical protein
MDANPQGSRRQLLEYAGSLLPISSAGRHVKIVGAEKASLVLLALDLGNPVDGAFAWRLEKDVLNASYLADAEARQNRSHRP